jgi:hypothetical protein
MGNCQSKERRPGSRIIAAPARAVQSRPPALESTYDASSGEGHRVTIAADHPRHDCATRVGSRPNYLYRIPGNAIGSPEITQTSKEPTNSLTDLRNGLIVTQPQVALCNGVEAGGFGSKAAVAWE